MLSAYKKIQETYFQENNNQKRKNDWRIEIKKEESIPLKGTDKTFNFIFPLLSCTSWPGTRDTSQTLLHPSGQGSGCQTKPGPQNRAHSASCGQGS
jgi:hypothetical protein